MGPCFLGAGRSLIQLKGQQGCPFIPSRAEGQHESHENHESHESNSCTKPQFPQQLSLCVLQVGPLQHTLTELAPVSASDFSSLNTSAACQGLCTVCYMAGLHGGGKREGWRGAAIKHPLIFRLESIIHSPGVQSQSRRCYCSDFKL